jgi:hypothetical protein
LTTAGFTGGSWKQTRLKRLVNYIVIEMTSFVLPEKKRVSKAAAAIGRQAAIHHRLGNPDKPGFKAAGCNTRVRVEAGNFNEKSFPITAFHA